MAGEIPLVVAYRPEWPTQAEAAIAELVAAPGIVAQRFDHIGSTSILMMSAKDVIDLQVSVSSLKEADHLLAGPLTACGFSPTGSNQDHIPEGRDDDPELWRKRLWTRRIPRTPSINLHVRKAGSPNERFALLFRDWFRSHPDAVSAYGAFKVGLAGLTATTSRYADAKDPVVDVIMEAAEDWAANVQWRVESGDVFDVSMNGASRQQSHRTGREVSR